MNQTSCSSSNHVLWVLDYFILLSVLRGGGVGGGGERLHYGLCIMFTCKCFCLAGVGDFVKTDQTVAEVETDKVTK